MVPASWCAHVAFWEYCGFYLRIVDRRSRDRCACTSCVHISEIVTIDTCRYKWSGAIRGEDRAFLSAATVVA